MRKSLLSLMLLCFAFFGVARAEIVELGDGGTANNTYLPGFNYYNYSLSQQIYTACEIGTAGTINSIAFKNTGGEKTRSYNVYMLLTDKETFTGGTDWVAMSDDDLVFSGSVTFTVDEWTTITLDTPFVLDGVYNLLVGVADVTGGYSSAPHMACLVYDATSQAIRSYRDSSAYDITAPGEYGTVVDIKNQIQLDITPNPDVTVCCPITSLSVYEPELTAYQARLMWEGDADNYDLEYKKASDTEWSSTITIGGTQYLIQDLQQNTAYNARVRSNCGTGYSYWKTVNFTTLEACASPSNVNVSETTAHGFTASFTPGDETQEMWFYYWSTSNETPTTQNYGTAMATTFTIEYNANLNSETTYYLWIGVQCGEEFNWSDPATFTTAVACLAPTDLTVTLTPGDGTVASLAWTENGTATSWDVYLSTDAEFSEYTSIQVDNVPSVELTDLTPETTYYARVNAFCEGEGISSYSNVVSFMPTNVYSLTVYDGTASNNVIPANIYYFDDYTRSQYVIPSENLEDMAYGTINSVKFYTTSSNIPYTTQSTVDVYLMEVDYTTMTGLEPKANGTIVYQGTLDVVTEGTGGSLTIEFTTPYIYQGGNLLVAIENTTDVEYKNIYFYGENVTGAAWGGSNGNSLENVIGISRPFIPKTTFTYVPGEAPSCLRPTDLTVSDITAHTAELSWTAGGDETAWEVEVTGEYAITWEALEPSLSLVGLDPDMPYSIKVRAVCGEENFSDWSIPVNFTTAVACPAPTDLSVTLTPGDGTRVELAWTENGTATSWDIQYGTDAEFNEYSSVSVDGNTPFGVIEGLTPETIYYARVMAYCDGAGVSSFSNVVSFTPTDAYTLTISDGTATSNMIPAYIYYFDDYTRSQYVIPSENLEDMAYGTINSVKFYTSSSNIPYTSVSTVDVYLMEVNYTSMTGFEPKANGTIVYQGTLDVVTEGTGGSLTIEFTTPYIYQGGNLLVAIENTTDVGFKNIYFYGENVTDAAWGGSNGNSLENVTGSSQSFIPKTTFTYVPGEAPSCLRPTDLTVSDITAHTAELSWTAGGDETAWEVEVTGEYASTWDVTEPSFSLVGLDPEADYSVKVRAVCGEENFSDWSIPVNFTTLVACPAPTDLTVTLTPGDGTVAALAWTENGTATEWDVEYGTDEEFSDFMIVNVSETPSFVLEDLTPETTYYARVKTYCGDEGYSQYSNIVSFTPSNTYTITVYDGTNTNNYAPIYGLWADKHSKSQFIIPAEELDAMYKGTISKLTFYASQTSVFWENAEFEVYMTEVDYTAFDAPSLVDWSSMTKVMDAGILSVSNNTMEVIFDTPYQYMGGNLLIGVLQTTPGYYQSCTWYGASQEENTTIGGYENSKGLGLYQFLPKTTFAYTPFTIEKDIVGYGEGDGNYYLIASPVGTVAATAVENLTYNEYDFYAFDQSFPGAEWRNYKGDEETGYEGGFDLAKGQGYLYANSEDVTLTFVGTPMNSDTYEVTLAYDDDANLKGWNLVGNPFVETAYIGRDFYTMNGDGSEIIASTSSSIEAMEGIFVIAEYDGETMTFNAIAPEDKGANLALNLSQGRGVVDRAIVRFGEGQQLPKLQLNPNHTKVYIPMDNEEYAVVRAAEMGEMPVNFKAESNGTYTLGINTENVEMAYLHLIDNLTGADVDLLVNPSYSFEANTTDYASRFKLVFATGDNSDENFAFFSNGSFIISNEGEATLQVLDVNGRILSSENISGCASVNVKAAAGVYLLRLINGDNVKVQKVVVK